MSFGFSLSDLRRGSALDDLPDPSNVARIEGATGETAEQMPTPKRSGGGFAFRPPEPEEPEDKPTPLEPPNIQPDPIPEVLKGVLGALPVPKTDNGKEVPYYLALTGNGLKWKSMSGGTPGDPDDPDDPDSPVDTTINIGIDGATITISFTAFGQTWMGTGTFPTIECDSESTNAYQPPGG